MTASAKTTRAAILDQGLDLLSETGLAGVTLGVLAMKVGMSKSGLFAHFRSNQAVQLALMAHMAEVAGAVALEPAMAAEPGLTRLTRLVELWFGWTARAGLSGGCPVAAALFELDDMDGEVRAAVLAMERRWRDVLGDLTREAMVLGDLSPDLDVDQFVWELCGVYLSHHASSRFLKDPAADRRAAAAFEALLLRARLAAAN